MRLAVLVAPFLASLALIGQERGVDTALEKAARAIEQGQPAEAEHHLEAILKSQPSELRALILMGAALDAEQRYRDAGPYYERALNIAPGSPQVLNNAGNHFLASGNRARARELYLRVLRVEPRHANANLQLASISVEDRKGRQALEYLNRLGSSEEPGVLSLRARALSLSGQCAQATGIAGQMESSASSDPSLSFAAGLTFSECKLYEQAETAFSAALRSDPRNFDIRYNLAWAALRAGHSGRAINIFETTLAEHPESPDCLYALSQAYVAESQPVRAAALLVKVQKIAPGRADVLLLLAQVSAQLHFYDDSAAAYSEYLKLKPADQAARHERDLVLVRARERNAVSRSGLVGYLKLPPAEQRARYLAWLQKSSAANPGDSPLRLTLASELLSDGKTTDAVAVLNGLMSIHAIPAVLAGAGRVLLEFEQYEPARAFLEASLAGAPLLSTARLDLAIALFQLRKPEVALARLDETPAADRNADYFLLRAQILDSLGKLGEAADSLNRGMQAAPTQTGVYFQAAEFLLKHKLYADALSLLEQACRVLPDARELILARAVTLIHLKRMVDAQNLLAAMQARWPEWERPYLLNGILLELQRKSEEARKLLHTAIALGANTPEAHYYEALAITHAAPDDVQDAQKAIAPALAMAPNDPYVYVLAGKIALAAQDYATGIKRLVEATRIEPGLIPAHYALMAAYRSSGDSQKSAAEADEIKRLSDEKPASDQKPFSEDDFLFAVRMPAGPVEVH